MRVRAEAVTGPVRGHADPPACGSRRGWWAAVAAVAAVALAVPVALAGPAGAGNPSNTVPASPCPPGQPPGRPPGQPPGRPGQPTGRPPQYPPGACQLALSKSAAAAGEPVTVMGSGYAPGSTVRLAMVDRWLAAPTAGDDGTFTVTVTVPPVAPGDYTITADGVAPDGSDHTQTATFRVLASDGAPGAGTGGAAGGPDGTGPSPQTPTAPAAGMAGTTTGGSGTGPSGEPGGAPEPGSTGPAGASGVAAPLGGAGPAGALGSDARGSGAGWWWLGVPGVAGVVAAIVALHRRRAAAPAG